MSDPAQDELLQLLRVLVNQLPSQCAAQVADVLRDGTLWQRVTSPLLTKAQLAARWSVSSRKVCEAWPLLDRVDLGPGSPRATIESVEAYERERTIKGPGLAGRQRVRDALRTLPRGAKPEQSPSSGRQMIRHIQPRTKPRPPE